ncbi:MAG: hypothetical protein HFJ60_00510 [Clostridia bacterium]|jgi:hypothetical protein|nr:hypothetical protein [Clostridia bacterium]
MKNIVNIQLNESINKLNWKDKIIVKLFPNTVNKIYKLGIEYGFNNK